MVQLCFLIRQLNEGGAQRQLVELARGLDESRYGLTVVAFYSGGRFSADAARLSQVSYVDLGKRGRWDVVRFGYRLVWQMRRLRPHIIHGYLPAANLLCIALKPFLPGTRVVWGVRASIVDWGNSGWLDRIMFQLQCVFARLADLIIVNSQTGKEYHLAHGFPRDKVVVIPNGIDTEIFCPDCEGRKRVRADWGVAETEKLIGLVGRLDPMKDHPAFLQAAALVGRNQDHLRFICVGDGPADYRRELVDLARRLGLAGRIIWEGSRDDMPSVHNALDIATSSSYSEGFSNVIGEAMACGRPCVVTDVGDSAWIVGDTGVVVRPRNPQALAEGWGLMLERLAAEGPALSEKARRRVVLEFGRDKLVQRTSEALERVL